MKKYIFVSFLTLLLVNCMTNNKTNRSDLLQNQMLEGNFAIASNLIDSLLNDIEIGDEEKMHYLFLKDSMNRVSMDFNRSIEEVRQWIGKNHGFEPTDNQISEWENNLSLEYKIIDGEKRYFRNAAPNLFRVNAEALSLSKSEAPKTDLPRDELLVDAFRNKKVGANNFHFLLPATSFKIRYTITVKPDAVDDGEVVCAWLPFPRKDIARQFDVKFIDASHREYTLSEDKTEHNSIYLEQKAKIGEPTIFWAEYEFVSQGEWFDLDNIHAQKYDTSSELYKKYTSEKLPHIVFSNTLKQITDSVVGDASNPVEILQLCYSYIASNYPWASALEYSTIPNITDYALKYQKGDCGQVALLLISMLRYKGVPAHWQSGWMLHPGAVNLHDWAEVYFEGVGWVPVDISFGRGSEIDIKPSRKFFMSGIDSYRFYINSDFGGDFYPHKKYPRSESVDFQRGEVETYDGNLYFDKWYYRLEIL